MAQATPLELNAMSSTSFLHLVIIECQAGFEEAVAVFLSSRKAWHGEESGQSELGHDSRVEMLSCNQASENLAFAINRQMCSVR